MSSITKTRKKPQLELVGASNMHHQDSDSSKDPNLFQVIGSVLAAAFGVQSNKNRERDFQKGNVLLFIGVGVIGTILFVLLIVGTVKLVLG